MKTYGITFSYNGELRQVRTGRWVPNNYEWWQPIIAHFVDRSNTFKLECFLDDYDGLASAAAYGARNADAAVRIANSKEVWEGHIDEKLYYELTLDPFDKENKLKWISIFLKKDGKTLLCSEKYGKNLSLFGVNEMDLTYLSKHLEGNNFSFCIWEESTDGQQIGTESLLMSDDDIESLIEALKPMREAEQEAQQDQE